MRVVRLLDEPDWPSLIPAIDAIFFAASKPQSFAAARARDDFRERWLGRYLTNDLDAFFIARADHDASGTPAPQPVAGYLAGSLDNPAKTARFDDIGYFKQAFADLCEAYPAHLHINVDERFRNQGVGAALVAAFATHAAGRGTSGVHIVTSSAARNVRFYERAQFSVLRTVAWNASEIVFMGRVLGLVPDPWV